MSNDAWIGIAGTVLTAFWGLMMAYLRGMRNEAANRSRDIKADVGNLKLELGDLRREANQRSDEIEEQLAILRRESEQRIAATESRFDTRIREVEKEKLDVREWIRVSTSTREKIDLMINGLARVETRIESEYGVAKSIDRLAETLKGDSEE